AIDRRVLSGTITLFSTTIQVFPNKSLQGFPMGVLVHDTDDTNQERRTHLSNSRIREFVRNKPVMLETCELQHLVRCGECLKQFGAEKLALKAEQAGEKPSSDS